MIADDHNQIWGYVEAGESYTSIAKMMGSREIIAGEQRSLNHRPRCTLGSRPPAELFATAC